MKYNLHGSEKAFTCHRGLITSLPRLPAAHPINVTVSPGVVSLHTVYCVRDEESVFRRIKRGDLEDWIVQAMILHE